MSKKQGVKKGSAIPAEAMLKQIATLVKAFNSMVSDEDSLHVFSDAAYRERREEIRFQAQVETLDMVTIALGEMSKNHREAFFRRFNDSLTKTCKFFHEQVLDDFINNGDEEIWYAKEQVDRAIKAVTGSFFKPWDERYDRKRHTYGLRIGEDD